MSAPNRTQQIVLAGYRAGKSLDDIAAAAGISRNNARSCANRMRSRGVIVPYLTNYPDTAHGKFEMARAHGTWRGYKTTVYSRDIDDARAWLVRLGDG